MLPLLRRDNWSNPQVQNFINYLNKHRLLIPDYWYLHSEHACSIGSGAIESTVKQIGRRIKISGAQWNEKNVPLLCWRIALPTSMACSLRKVSAKLRCSQTMYFGLPALLTPGLLRQALLF